MILLGVVEDMFLISYVFFSFIACTAWIYGYCLCIFHIFQVETPQIELLNPDSSVDFPHSSVDFSHRSVKISAIFHKFFVDFPRRKYTIFS